MRCNVGGKIFLMTQFFVRGPLSVVRGRQSTKDGTRKSKLAAIFDFRISVFPATDYGLFLKNILKQQVRQNHKNDAKSCRQFDPARIIADRVTFEGPRRSLYAGNEYGYGNWELEHREHDLAHASIRGDRPERRAHGHIAQRAEKGGEREPTQRWNEGKVIPEACREHHDDLGNSHKEHVGEHFAEINGARIDRRQAHALQSRVLALRRKRSVESQHAGKGKRDPQQPGQQAQSLLSRRLEGKIEQEHHQEAENTHGGKRLAVPPLDAQVFYENGGDDS